MTLIRQPRKNFLTSISNETATISKPEGFTWPDITAFIAAYGLPTAITGRFGDSLGSGRFPIDEATIARHLTRDEGWWPSSEDVVFEGPVLEE